MIPVRAEAGRSLRTAVQGSLCISDLERKDEVTVAINKATITGN
jgi:hypothetical protein